MIVVVGYEIGNYFFFYEFWFYFYFKDKINDEFGCMEDVLEECMGVCLMGFRGFGFSVLMVILEILEE